jgi:hypothetical protein
MANGSTRVFGFSIFRDKALPGSNSSSTSTPTVYDGESAQELSMKHYSDSISVASLLAENVIPAETRITSSAAAGPLSFNADFVKLSAVTGGFNCVVEISDQHCLRVFAEDLDAGFWVRLNLTPVQLFFNAQTTAFESAYLNKLKAAGLTSTVQGITTTLKDLPILFTFEPAGITFFDPQKVTILYQVAVDIADFKMLSPGQPGGIEVIAALGQLNLEISTNYFQVSNSDLKRVDIFADMTRAEVEIVNISADVKRFIDYGFLGQDGSDLKHAVLLKQSIHLTPTISLVGKSPTNVTVTEIPDFNVQVFHITSAGAGAVAAAFDLMPGCHGLVEDVQLFIGDMDYGVISDESLVEALLKHKWRIGGFKRQIPIRRPTKVLRNGNEEDATLRGHLDLYSLDSVVLITDANDRTDYVQLGGAASLGVDDILLQDNEVVGPDKVDFGGEQNYPWIIHTAITYGDLNEDPDLRAFALKAYYDAYRHLIQPFAAFPDTPGALAVFYSRVEAVPGHVFFLGRIPEVFL